MINLKLWTHLVGAALFAAYSLPIAAANLATTTLNFTASGSPNTIGATWSAPPLDILPNDQVEYYEFEILNVYSPFGQPNYLTFISDFPNNSRELSFGSACPTGISCVGQPWPSTISTLNFANPIQWVAKEFVLRLDPDDQYYTSSGWGLVAFGGGGGPTTAEGSIRITAYGTAAPVPEPSTLILIVLGMAILFAGFHRNIKHT